MGTEPRPSANKGALRRLKRGRKRLLRFLARRLPALGPLLEAREELRRLRPGHYSSPIPSAKEVQREEKRLFDRSMRELPGIDLNVEGQLQLLRRLGEFHGDHPFSEEPKEGLRYFFGNDAYPRSDALFLHCMLRHARPTRIIEIGSGFSSFVMLDTNDLFLDGGLQLTCIEPDDRRLRSRLGEQDRNALEIIPRPVQEVDLALFDRLGGRDVLFVDSSHVAKIGSDVNHILFEILPRLAKGVYVHFHDIFFPFQYPKDWIERGWYWNEGYILRAFLQYNSAFKIVLWNHYLALAHPEALKASLPLPEKDPGQSLWLLRS